MSYEVHLDVFDGPFDLLLQLITAQEVDLYEVRLADIIEGFLAEMGRLQQMDLELATEFLLIAAILIELKCRRLLPGRDELDLDDDLALFEARDYLLARLVECRTFQGAAAVLAELEELAGRSLARRAGPDERFGERQPDLLADVTPEQLLEAARAALAERPVPVVSVEHVHAEEVNVAAVIAELRDEIAARGRALFRELTASSPSIAHRVACFLALLELYKASFIDLDQGETFGDLVVTWSGEERDGARDDLSGLLGTLDDYDQHDEISGGLPR